MRLSICILGDITTSHVITLLRIPKCPQFSLLVLTISQYQQSFDFFQSSSTSHLRWHHATLLLRHIKKNLPPPPYTPSTPKLKWMENNHLKCTNLHFSETFDEFPQRCIMIEYATTPRLPWSILRFGLFQELDDSKTILTHCISYECRVVFNIENEYSQN